ncbi:valyl-tRNA synthetase [Bradyrhizobium sp. LM3.4]
MIEKNYQPADIEARMSVVWEDSLAFKAGRPDRRDAVPFTIVIPPPNVTGSLHMGHALNNTLQDILCRFERMRGRDVLWQPGTDHAGIATQMVVERQLMERQQPSRREIGREKFLERVWQWKAESGDTIINQLKRLGASCDWSRERFTMDEGLSKAVVKVFVDLHRDGLIYKDKRLVNWDTKLLTAISDLEVQQTEVKGSLWYLRYPIEGKIFNPEDPSSFIVVATTRPETMLGDTGVAVHPDDERYQKLVGKHIVLPLVGRKVQIVADDYSDPEKGSGAVKVTPAHDFNDFEVGNRHGLRRISVLDKEGCLDLLDNEDYLRDLPEGAAHFAEEFHKVDRFAARKRIVERLDSFGFVERIEPHTNMVPHGDRSGTVIEPYLTDQWYVDAKTLAKPAMAAVRSGETTFVPKNWEKTYFEWMENIQPWCISRQLWWGHQIPAWYGPDGKVFVAETEEEAVSHALGYYVEQEVITVEQGREMALDRNKRDGFITRDEDVLDTWFSSALWPFSTLGWPEDAPEVQRYYPTNVLVTGFDIIFFWVARMMMMGLHFMKEVPFSTIYIHALVRDEKGAKMSKSKGNVIDPLNLIDEYGADALRFTLAAMAAQGRDIKLATSRVEGYRNFATKLWNASRFAEMNHCAVPEGFEPAKVKETLNRWIAHESAHTTREVTEAIEAYRFNDAAGSIYRFVWNVYCDWYVELAKPVLLGPDSPAKAETRAMVAWARDEILKLLHPFMPFITEEFVGGDGQARRSARAGTMAAEAVRADAGAACDACGNDGADRCARLSGLGAADLRPCRLHRSRGRGRDRLGDRPRHPDPFGARRDEHRAGDSDGTGARRRLDRDEGSRASLERRHQAHGAAVRHLLRRSRARRRGSAAGARRGGRAAAQGRDRRRRRAYAPRQGDRESRRRHQARRVQAGQREVRRQRGRGSRGGRAREA